MQLEFGEYLTLWLWQLDAGYFHMSMSHLRVVIRSKMPHYLFSKYHAIIILRMANSNYLDVCSI